MPRAGDAYLQGALPQSHNPLDRISFQPPDTSLDFSALLDMWRQWFTDIAIPLFEEFTGLDISSPEAFITSLIGMIANGGAAALQFAEMILNSIGTLLGIPNLGQVIQKLALLPSLLLNAATGGEQSGSGDDDDLLQKLFDALLGIFGGGSGGGPDPTDHTPPTAPNLTLNTASYTTLTVTASGAVDPP